MSSKLKIDVLFEQIDKLGLGPIESRNEYRAADSALEEFCEH